jgi:hypothetical protein
MRYLMLRIAFAAVAILLQTSASFACTCGPSVSVLDEYERAQLVVIARVTAIQMYEQKQMETYGEDGRAQLVIEKVYKGDARAGDALSFAQGSGVDCAWRFSDEMIGQRSLMYLNTPRPGSKWRVSSCGRSGNVKNVTEDLLYLDKMDQVRGKTRVSGRYVRGFYTGDLVVADKKIRIVGENQTYETTTDENGVFEIYDLRPGNYRLEPELQAGLEVDRDWLWFSGGAIREQSTDTSVAFTLKPQKHVSLQLGFKPKEQKWGTTRPD